MTSTLDRPVKVTAFQGVSLRRKVTNNVATVLVTLSVWNFSHTLAVI